MAVDKRPSKYQLNLEQTIEHRIYHRYSHTQSDLDCDRPIWLLLRAISLVSTQWHLRIHRASHCVPAHRPLHSPAPSLTPSLLSFHVTCILLFFRSHFKARLKDRNITPPKISDWGTKLIKASYAILKHFFFFIRMAGEYVSRRRMYVSTYQESSGYNLCF